MKRNLLSILLCAALLCTLLSGLSLNSNAADAEGKLDNMTWRIDNNVLTLSGSGAMPKADNKTQWRAYYETVTRVIIEPGITSISDQAFYNFFRMSEISIPETVRTIGEDVFWACPQLTRIDIPEGVESIGG